MDQNTLTISAIVLATTAITGVILKFVHSLRGDIKSCCCIIFRTPIASPRNQIEMTTIQPHNITHSTTPNIITSEELENRLKGFDDRIKDLNKC